MERVELIKMHRQILRTPTYIRSLQEWQIQELFLFSIDLVSRGRRYIKKQQNPEIDWENESIWGMYIHREQALQKILKGQLEKPGEEIKSPPILTMYGDKNELYELDQWGVYVPPDVKAKDKITREEILDKAHELKKNGMKDEPLFDHFKKWLFNDLGFTNPELKQRFNFELHEHEEAHKTFSRFVNKNRSHTKKNR